MSDFCQENLPTQRKEPLITTPLPERAWKKIGTDLYKHEGKQFLVVIYYYSRFPEIAFMSSITSDAVINKLKHLFARWGVPDEILSDNGPQFSSDQFRKFSQEYDFKYTITSPYYPQANSKHHVLEEGGVGSVCQEKVCYNFLISFAHARKNATGMQVQATPSLTKLPRKHALVEVNGTK